MIFLDELVDECALCGDAIFIKTAGEPRQNRGVVHERVVGDVAVVKYVLSEAMRHAVGGG